MLNTIMAFVALFSFLFAVLSHTGLNPLGMIHTTVDYIYSLIALFSIFWLRGSKERYTSAMLIVLTSSLFAFISALLFVPQDEFRIIWFYLLIFAAFITGGVRVGTIFSFLSIGIVIGANILTDLQLSETAINSAVLGLVIGVLFTRAYTKKIIDYEEELTAFNSSLEEMVEQKTTELQELNRSLEAKVEEKVHQITAQERLMITQSRLAAMGEMMSMIAHQWRQPLATTTLMITNEQLKAMMAGKEPSECDKILQKISDTMLYLSDTIDDFQTYFKPDKSAEEISVCEIIERVLHFTEPRRKLCKVQFDVQCGEENRLETYANEVVQVLINIINNAFDAFVERQQEARRIVLAVSAQQESVTITVEDNAGGIDASVIERVFDPYFSTKSKNGTGLGLYMAKMIVENHIGGKLSVSNTQEGACFSVEIPRAVEPTPPL